MTPARARLFVAAVGALCLAVAALSLLSIGGPEASRAARRDALRLDALREIARAIRCERRASGRAPVDLAEISEACLAPARAAELVDPLTGAAYAIDLPGPAAARVCARFEAPGRMRFHDASDARFDRESGCVALALVP